MSKRGSSRKTRRIRASQIESAASVLRVLAHPQRLRMVEVLLEGIISVGDLAHEVGMGQPAVSQHLNHMRAHGIVGSLRDGRKVFYEVIDPHAIQVIECIRAHG